MKIALSKMGLLTAAILILPATGYAQQQAYTAKSVHVRAGPARDYPVIAILPPGVPLTVEGCLSDYSWCEVVLADSNRGWMYAGNLSYAFNGANVSVLTYGGLIGLGIVSFSVGSYWDTYYRGRPWYRDRQRWIDHPKHPRPQMAPGLDHLRPPVRHVPSHIRPPAVHSPTQSRPPGRSCTNPGPSPRRACTRSHAPQRTSFPPCSTFAWR